ncbi:hypothetical protein RN001_013422 [Aquatica leii]|uniref:CCHC-type domain-containing protein n=1 Tax=Aquatica leii TaxID=1421715 RepID=A0AAN7P012_9COLE|nr:hypothetical protein RN001_013422 [Aquatica leii]
MAIILDGMKALKQLKDGVHKQNEKIDNVNQQLIVNQDKIKKQKSVDTKNDIKKCIDPTDMNITGIRPVSNGGILIECKNKDDVCKLKEKAETKMGESYKIQLPKKKLPRIKIVGLSENLPPEIIEEKIKMQNSHINSEKSSLKIVHTKEGRNRKSYIAYAEVNAYTYRAIMKEKKINVGWDRCIVYDAIEIRRCYRCNGFNHKASECKACPKCAGSHGLQECTVDGEENHKCSNCIQMAEKLKMKLDINHPVWKAPNFNGSKLTWNLRHNHLLCLKSPAQPNTNSTIQVEALTDSAGGSLDSTENNTFVSGNTESSVCGFSRASEVLFYYASRRYFKLYNNLVDSFPNTSIILRILLTITVTTTTTPTAASTTDSTHSTESSTEQTEVTTEGNSNIALLSLFALTVSVIVHILYDNIHWIEYINCLLCLLSRNRTMCCVFFALTVVCFEVFQRYFF